MDSDSDKECVDSSRGKIYGEDALQEQHNSEAGRCWDIREERYRVSGFS